MMCAFWCLRPERGDLVFGGLRTTGWCELERKRERERERERERRREREGEGGEGRRHPSLRTN